MTISEPNTDPARTMGFPAAYRCENFPGRMGVAKKQFIVGHVALEKGVEIAAGCRCSSGCRNRIEPAKSWDISNANIDRARWIEPAGELLAAVERGPGVKFQDGLLGPILRAAVPRGDPGPFPWLVKAGRGRNDEQRVAWGTREVLIVVQTMVDKPMKWCGPGPQGLQA